MDHAYLRGAPDSAYWSIAPHRIQQSTDSSCSLATAVMLINAVRGREGYLRIGEPVSEASLLGKLGDVPRSQRGAPVTEVRSAANPAAGAVGTWKAARSARWSLASPTNTWRSASIATTSSA
jgi:hypothetical protein